MLKTKNCTKKQNDDFFSFLTFSKSSSVVLKLRFFTNNVNVSSSIAGSSSTSDSV